MVKGRLTKQDEPAAQYIHYRQQGLARTAKFGGLLALFSDKNAAGKVDQEGMVWKGLNTARRIARIRQNSTS